MYNTAEWAEVRERNGWANDYKPHQEFAHAIGRPAQRINDENVTALVMLATDRAAL